MLTDSRAPYECTLGSKDPINRVLGRKHYNINGIWVLKTLSFGSLDP